MEEIGISRNDNSRYIYIVLSQTGTVPAKLIKFYTRNPYAHASIAFDSDLSEMYSFARRGIWNPFNSGFIKEDFNSGIFGRYESTRCSIYKIEVTSEQYERIRSIIGVFKNDSLSYSYNYLGILGVVLHHPIARRKRYFCSQFVAYVLYMAGIKVANKVPALVRPDDLRKSDLFQLVYAGRLSEYRTYLNENSLYGVY